MAISGSGRPLGEPREAATRPPLGRTLPRGSGKRDRAPQFSLPILDWAATQFSLPMQKSVAMQFSLPISQWTVTQNWEGGVKLVLDKPNKDKDTPKPTPKQPNSFDG